MAQTHETTRDRELNEARASLEKLRADRADIDAKIEQKQLLIEAWTNFELTLQGKFKASGPVERTPRKASGTRAKRGELGGFRKDVYDFVAQHTKGLEASEVQAHFKGEKKPTAISAALFNLGKQGHLYQESRGKPYFAVEQAEPSTTPSDDKLATADETAA